MAEVHHFTYGAFNPVAAYLVAFLGCVMGLLCTQRARAARSPGRRNRWLVIAAFSIGGAAIWLMHFTAMLGFEVPASPVRYDLTLTLISLGLAVVSVGIGLMMVGHGRRSHRKTLLAGLITGGGILAMHYTGIRALHFAGDLRFHTGLVAVSGMLGLAAATVALWFSQSARGWPRITGAAAVLAAAVCGMHYTGVAALTVELSPVPAGGVGGIPPMLMIVPITLVTAVTIITTALSALQAMTEEEFTDGAGMPRRGVHAEHPWSLKQASAMAMRRSRPFPRPVPVRAAPAPAPELRSEPTVVS